MTQLVKNLPAMQELGVWSLGWQDPLEKGMASHSRILAGEFHGQRSLLGYSPWGRKESDTTEWLSLSLCDRYCHSHCRSLAHTLCTCVYVQHTAYTFRIAWSCVCKAMAELTATEQSCQSWIWVTTMRLTSDPVANVVQQMWLNW